MTSPPVSSPTRRAKRLPPLAQLALALLLGLAAAAGYLAWQYIPAAGWTSNDVTTGQHPGYPALTPHRYDMPVASTTVFAAQAATRLGWQVTRTDPATGAVEAVAPVPLTPFKDDVTIQITGEPAAHGGTSETSLVTIRSRSRLGKGDLGQNARHIRALQAAMDDKLPPAP